MPNPTKKLVLNRETIRLLTPSDMADVIGGKKTEVRPSGAQGDSCALGDGTQATCRCESEQNACSDVTLDGTCV